MLTWREVWYYVRLLLRWWWLLALAVALPAGITFYRTQNQPDYYVTETTISIGNSFTSASPNPNAIDLSNTLADYYSEIARRSVILQPVAEELQLPLSPGDLRGMIGTDVNQRANLLQIRVTDTNPERATRIANAVANELIRFGPTSPERLAEERAELDAQIQDAEDKLSTIDVRLAELEDLEANAQSAFDITSIQSQIDALESSYDETQSTYLQLLELRDGNEATTMEVFEPATVPGRPVPSKQGITMLTAGAGGLFLAILGILLLNRLDDRWRDGKELQDYLGLPYFGNIPGSQPMIVLPPPQAARREYAVREAYTRIMLSAMERDGDVLLISSPRPAKARSAFTVDLAELYARSGHRVLIVDADMLVDDDLTMSYLSYLMLQEDERQSAIIGPESDGKMRAYVQPTPLENVMLLGRRIGPEDDSQVPMLPWPELVPHLRRNADIILFDGPSVLNGADAALLAHLVDGVVLALDPTRDARSDIVESKSRLQRKREATLLGAVVVSGKSRSSRNGSKSLGKPSSARMLGTADDNVVSEA